LAWTTFFCSLALKAERKMKNIEAIFIKKNVYVQGRLSASRSHEGDEDYVQRARERIVWERMF
jgi:hypothetical protein